MPTLRPTPTAADLALALHLIGELNEMERLRQLSTHADRYEAKSAQIRNLGFDIGPNGRGGPGGLCLYDRATQLPLTPAPTEQPAPCLAITTIHRADIFDQLCEAVDAARISAADSPAWLSRIDQAWGWLIQQESYEIRDFGTDHAAVRIPSATHSHITYEANGKCQCPAYTSHTPCWHRAASRLLRNALTSTSVAPLLRRCDDLTIAPQTLVDELYA